MKLNLGCWKRYFPGYIHIDLCDMPHIDYKTDIGDLQMLKENSVDLIYCSHALEYKSIEEIKNTLGEWYRVLKEGGVLRISVPNFEALIEIYQKYSDIRLIQGPIFGFMKQNELVVNHKILFDYDLLKSILIDAGFKEIEYYDWRNTDHAHIDDHSQAYYPHMDKENGILVSLNLECKK